MSFASTCTPSHAHDLVLVLGFNVYPVPCPRPCPWPFPEPRPMRPEFRPCPANLAWVILDHARTQLKINVGRRGTDQLRLLERYLDVLVKHTTEIPPPTVLVEGTAPVCLSRRRIVKMIYFNLWVLDFTKPNPCAHMLPVACGKWISNTRESLGIIVKSLSNIEISLS
jgi:hypothetical protein